MRAAMTARMWARRASGGGTASHLCPVWRMPGGVSQHQNDPRVSWPVAASPALRQRAVMPLVRSSVAPR